MPPGDDGRVDRGADLDAAEAADGASVVLRRRPQRRIRDQLAGLNPALVGERYARADVREAVKAAALLAVYDTAALAAGGRDAGRD